MSDSLWPHGLYSPWNSPGQNTGVGHRPLLQGISQSRDRTQVSHIAGRFFTSWVTREMQLEGQEFWASLVAQLVNSPMELSLYFCFNFRISLSILPKKKKPAKFCCGCTKSKEDDNFNNSLIYKNFLFIEICPFSQQHCIVYKVQILCIYCHIYSYVFHIVSF